ncbi:MAG TPA: PQQ-binding-like beta-propeller repeat protein, partial [Oligoflexus sp.]|uniref:PQQ-binding-like beta-propeller repeat protein n=1 Tax=Oligoflexus sp. TaxID=1971216 RepID=UPI002D452876
MKSLRLAPWILSLVLSACTHVETEQDPTAPDVDTETTTGAAATPGAATSNTTAPVGLNSPTAPDAAEPASSAEAGVKPAPGTGTPNTSAAAPGANAKPSTNPATGVGAAAATEATSSGAQPCLDVNVSSFSNCRPFRTGMIKLAPQLDAEKPIGAIDESGWSMATDVLIGSVDPGWVSAYHLKSKTFTWWLKIPESMTAPAEVFGSWAVIPLRDGRLLKVETQTGKQLWETRLSRFVTAKTTLSGNVLLAYSADQKLYAIDFQTGQHLWVYDTGTAANLLLRAGSGPVVAGNEVIFGTTEGDVRSVSLNSGKENWKLDPSREDFRFKDVVGEIGIGNHQIYVARSDGLVFAVDTLNRPSDALWKETFSSVTSSAYRDGTYVIGCINGDLIALQASTGRQLWKVNTGASIKTITIGEKAIFVGGSQGRIT